MTDATGRARMRPDEPRALDAGTALGTAIGMVVYGRSAMRGVTWGSVKAAIAGLGVEDDDVIAAIEIGVMQAGSGRLVRDDEPDGIEIREV